MLWLSIASAHAAEVALPDVSTSTAATTDSSCSRLDLGASLTVNQSRTESPTGIQRSFRLTRDRQDGNIYHVELPLEFAARLEARLNQPGGAAALRLSPNDRDPGNTTPAAALAGKVLRAEATAAFIARTNECYTSMRGKLFAADGTQIYFSVTRATPELTRAVVAISPEPHRSNISDWSRTADCSVIIHESLHWLGLADGYPESQFSCRSLEPTHSIMHDNQAALDANFDFADCGPMLQPGGTTPITPVTSVDSVTCPSGEAPVIRRNVTRPQFISYRDTHLNRNYFYSSAQAIPVPLFPAHVRMITQPNCRSANERYVTCVQNSYRDKAQGCLTTPQYCQKQNYLN